MKALPRILVTGTVGGLAALTAASSGAFACTATAGVTGNTPVRGFVAPGEPLTLTMKNFHDPATWPGATLVRVVLHAPDGVETLIAERPGPAFTLEWTVPLWVKPNARSKYAIRASQYNYQAPYTPEGFQVYIAEGTARLPSSTTTNPPTPLPTTTPTVASTVRDEPVPQDRLEQVGGGIGSARSVTARRSADSPPSAPGRVVVVDPASGASGTNRLGIDSGTPPPQDRTAAAPADQPLVPAESMWSGINGGDPPSLLGPSLLSDQGGGPLPNLLLGAGAGLLALTGLAFGLTHRRLAFARRR